MRVESWNPSSMDENFENVSLGRLAAAARVIALATSSNCPVGTISHPMYQRGKYANQNWTSRDAGRLKKSVRVTRKRTSGGRAFSRKKSIRVYAGHYMAWYANIVEHYTPFMRPAQSQTLSEVKAIIGAS